MKKTLSILALSASLLSAERAIGLGEEIGRAHV